MSENTGAAQLAGRDYEAAAGIAGLSAVLARFAAELTTATTGKEVGKAILTAADELFGWDASLFDYLPEGHGKDGDSLTRIAAVRFDLVNGKRVELPGIMTAPLTPMTIRVFRDGPQLLLREEEEDANTSLDSFGEHQRKSLSLMFVPVRSESRNIGIVSIQSYRARRYTSADLDLLNTLATICAPTLDRVLANEHLRNAQLQYRDLLEQSPGAILNVDRNGCILEVNSRTCKLIEIPRESLVGSDHRALGNLWRDALDPERLQQIANGDLPPMKLTTGGTQKALHIEVDVRMRHDSSFQVILNDITEKEAADREREAFSSMALELSAADTLEKLGQVVWSVAEALWQWDALVLSYRQPGSLSFKPFLLVDTVNGRKKTFPAVEYALSDSLADTMLGKPVVIHRTQAELELESRNVPFGDLERPSVSLVYVPIRSLDATVGMLSVQSYDPGRFTDDDAQQLLRLADAIGPSMERCRAEAALREHQRSVSTLMSSLPGMAYRCLNDEHWTATFVSDGCLELTGYSPGDLINNASLTYADLIYPADQQRTRELVEEGIRARSSFEAEYRIIHRDGQLRWVFEKGEPVFNEDGELQALEGFISDVTDRHRSEQEQVFFSGLGLKLAAADSLSDVADAISESTSVLWQWDSFFITVRTRGKGVFETILAVDTIDGRRVELPRQRHSTRDYLQFGGKSLTEPMLLNRSPEKLGPTFTRFGDQTRPSLSSMYIPVTIGSATIAVLSIQSYEEKRFTPYDLNVLEKIGSVTGQTIERCLADTRSAAFSSLGQSLSAARTQREAAGTIASVAEALLGWDACSLNLYNPADDTVTVVLNMDLIEGQHSEVPSRTPVGPPTPNCRRVIEEGAQLILRSSDDEPGELRVFGDTARRSMSLLFVPIHSGGRVIGTVSIQSYSIQAYDEADLRVLQALADHCSGALERTRAEEELRQYKEQLDGILGSLNDVVWSVDVVSQRTLYVNRAVRHIYGVAPEAFYQDAELWTKLLHPDDFERVQSELAQGHLEVEYRIIRPDGETRWIHDKRRMIRGENGLPARYDILTRDITERKRAEEALRHGAMHDNLTDLPNRAYFMECLARAIARRQRREQDSYAVLFLDLDRFKVVNDSLGHLVGDHLLISAARRLQTCVRPGDVVARLGGDEFTVLLDGIESPADATQVAERIQAELARPHLLSGNDVYTTVSIGIAIGSSNYHQPAELLRDADTAMYRAKGDGKARYQIFDKHMHEKALRQLELETDLRRAIERQQFILEYQPIISLDTHQTVGLEALVRWQHPTKGLVPPGDFIPIAEETNLIVPIGNWVLEHVAECMSRWKKLLPDQTLEVSVNVSSRQFAQQGFVEEVGRILHKYRVDKGALALEITESVLIENSEVAGKHLSNLKALGVDLHVDDFGTGYSSLGYLQQFPVDVLKIDRSFVRNVENARRDQEIIRAIVTLAKGLEMEVIAEGVEHASQMPVLMGLGCTMVQGYHISRPIAEVDLKSYLLRNPCAGTRRRRESSVSSS